MAVLREALWHTLQRWQLTPQRPKLLPLALQGLQQAVSSSDAEAALWVLSRCGA